MTIVLVFPPFPSRFGDMRWSGLRNSITGDLLIDDYWDHGTGPDLISSSSLVCRILSFFSSQLLREQLPVDVAASCQRTVAAAA